MDLALALAESTGAALAIALDPDADRCGLGASLDGKWTMIHGDRLGCLLGEWIAGRIAGGEDPPGISPGSHVLARSVVSSRLLDAIAAHHGLKAETTLTGFKWLSRVPGLAFAYEEALGYCVAPKVVRDKDGISTALLAAEFASLLASRDSCLADALDDLDRSYGVHLTRLVPLRMPGRADLARVVAGILALPPTTLGGSPVVSVENGLDGLDGLPPTPGVRLMTAAGTRVIVRPSGTESMVKAYLEIVRPPSEDLVRDRTMTNEAMAALEADTRVLLHT
jgi:phosphomannomutase